VVIYIGAYYMSVRIFENSEKTGNKRLHRIPQRYLPKTLSKKDRRTQLQALKKSRSLYKKGIYYARPSVKNATRKKSGHVELAKRIYGVDNIVANNKLAVKTGCTISGLSQIIRKGEGAYYSSGSRPGQTAFSWGRARLASAITGGPASVVDRKILETTCKPNGLARKMSR